MSSRMITITPACLRRCTSPPSSPRLSGEPPDEERRRDDEPSDEPDHSRDAPEQHEGRLACAASRDCLLRRVRRGYALVPRIRGGVARGVHRGGLSLRASGHRSSATRRPRPQNGTAPRVVLLCRTGFTVACAPASDGTRLVELDASRLDAADPRGASRGRSAGRSSTGSARSGSPSRSGVTRRCSSSTGRVAAGTGSTRSRTPRWSTAGWRR